MEMARPDAQLDSLKNSNQMVPKWQPGSEIRRFWSQF